MKKMLSLGRSRRYMDVDNAPFPLVTHSADHIAGLQGFSCLVGR